MLPRLLFACVVLTLGLWASVTHARATVWQSNLRLWTDAAANAPLRPRAFINLGIEYELAGDLNAASQAYLQAIALSQQPRLSTYARAFHRAAGEVNQARVLARLGYMQAALQLLDGVIVRHPNFPHARYAKAVIYGWLGDCAEAKRWRSLAGSQFPEPVCHA